MVKVSIITPTFNSSKYISETIIGVINQTYSNWELIIIDDKSTDNTIEIVKKIQAKENRIVLIESETNNGAGVARNRGLEIANGRYISFLDSDDIWEPTKLESQLGFMDKNDAAISFTGYSIMDESMVNVKSVINVPHKLDLHSYLKNTVIGMSTSMIDKSKVGDFRLNKIRSRQDGILWIELLKSGFIAYGLNEQLVKYRFRNDSVSANKLKAMSKVWYIYRAYAKLNFIQTLYFFFFYVYNNLKRRYLK